MSRLNEVCGDNSMANMSEAFDQDIEPDRNVRMVLRTVYLPPDIDDELRVRAFRSNQTKNDLIREAVTRWLDEAGLSTAKAKGVRGGKAKATSNAKPRTRTVRAKSRAKTA